MQTDAFSNVTTSDLSELREIIENAEAYRGGGEPPINRAVLKALRIILERLEENLRRELRR